MNSAEKKNPWFVVLARPAQKSLERIPSNDQGRIRFAIEEMAKNPLLGDVRKLKGGRDGFRRRIGDWRVFFDLYPAEHRVVVTAIVRRTSTTY